MADTTVPTQSQEPKGTNWLEEVKRDAEYNYKRLLAHQKADAEYKASKEKNANK